MAGEIKEKHNLDIELEPDIEEENTASVANEEVPNDTNEATEVCAFMLMIWSINILFDGRYALCNREILMLTTRLKMSLVKCR